MPTVSTVCIKHSMLQAQPLHCSGEKNKKIIYMAETDIYKEDMNKNKYILVLFFCKSIPETQRS